MNLIENLKTARLSDFLIVIVVFSFIALWSYAEVKGSIFRISFNIIRAILYLLLTTPLFFIFARNNFGGFTFQNVLIITGVQVVIIAYFIIKSKRFS